MSQVDDSSGVKLLKCPWPRLTMPNPGNRLPLRNLMPMQPAAANEDGHAGANQASEPRVSLKPESPFQSFSAVAGKERTARREAAVRIEVSRYGIQHSRGKAYCLTI